MAWPYVELELTVRFSVKFWTIDQHLGGCRPLMYVYVEYSDERIPPLGWRNFEAICNFDKETLEIWPCGVDGWIQSEALHYRPQIGVIQAAAAHLAGFRWEGSPHVAGGIFEAFCNLNRERWEIWAYWGIDVWIFDYVPRMQGVPKCCWVCTVFKCRRSRRVAGGISVFCTLECQSLLPSLFDSDIISYKAIS
jgi:hypothetical protein